MTDVDTAEPARAAGALRVSIVVPTFNRARLLPKTIPALANQQTRPGVSYEVIFVSNGSTDASDAILKEAVARYPDRLRYHWIAPTGGPSAPRNRGIREATGDVIVILDDDVLPDPDLVLRYAEFHLAHPEPNHAAVGEAYVPPHLLDDPMSLFHVFPYDKVRHLERLPYLYFWTCNVSVKRSFMLESGMFDERFLYNEDVICGHRLDRAGMHLHFLPAARGEHLHQLQPSGLEAKGIFTGRWIHATVQHLPEREIIDRYGVLSPKLGPARYAKRLLNRIAFRALDNPLTHAALKMAGATNGKRSRASDLHYYLVFRRNIVRGYNQAKREARAGVKPVADDPSSAWVDRGDTPGKP